MAEAYRCKHCWAGPDRLSELVKTPGWRAITNLHPEFTDKGAEKIGFEKKGSIEHDTFDAERTAFHCSNCDREEYRLEDLVEKFDDRPSYECRTCGWTGSDVADHPITCGEEAELLEDRPVPEGQESLDIPG